MDEPRRFDVRSDEPVAAQWVATALGGAEVNRHDTGASPGRYDYRLVLSDGTTIALELTSSGSSHRELNAALARHRGSLSVEGLGRTWVVAIDPTTNVKRLIAAFPAFLRQHDAEGGGRLLLDEEATDATSEIRAAGVRQLAPWGEPGEVAPDGIRIHIGIIGVHAGQDGFIAAVAAELGKPDNIAKLKRADCDERHLYIRVDDPRSATSHDHEPPLPRCPPDPSGVVDTVWAWTPWSPGDLLRAAPGGEWEWRACQ
jgi:hypothetical protein